MRVHHFGIGVRDIEGYLSHSVYKLRSEIVTGHVQGAGLCTVPPSGDEVAIVELISVPAIMPHLEGVCPSS